MYSANPTKVAFQATVTTFRETIWPLPRKQKSRELRKVRGFLKYDL